jgi:hypothetical protein
MIIHVLTGMPEIFDARFKAIYSAPNAAESRDDCGSFTVDGHAFSTHNMM